MCVKVHVYTCMHLCAREMPLPCPPSFRAVPPSALAEGGLHTACFNMTTDAAPTTEQKTLAHRGLAYLRSAPALRRNALLLRRVRQDRIAHCVHAAHLLRVQRRSVGAARAQCMLDAVKGRPAGRLLILRDDIDAGARLILELNRLEVAIAGCVQRVCSSLPALAI